MIVGKSDTHHRSSKVDHPVRWSSRHPYKVTPLEPDYTSCGKALAVSNRVKNKRRVIVGQLVAKGSGQLTAFRFTLQGKNLRPLNDPPHEKTDSSEARDVSMDGAVIVGQFTSDQAEHAFVWFEKSPYDAVPSRRMLRLADVLESLGAPPRPGWRLQQSSGISSDGTLIAGVGTNPKGHPEGWVADISPTPYP